MIDTDTPFARAIADKDVAAAIALARDDPTVINLKLPSSYKYERALHAAVRVKVVAKQIEQRVEITYDLDDVDGDLMKVGLLASSDGGKNLDLPVKSVEGEM